MATTPPDKLSVIVQSGDFDRVHYALMTVAAAVAVNMPATLFFTMGACRALAKPQDGRPGWVAMRTAGGEEAAAWDAALEARKLATFEELLEACVALGARVMVCETGLAAMDMEASDLRADVPAEVTGLVSFLKDSSATGTTLFV